ncbi:CRE-STR-220 protein [Caenorhabditis remanei]|uniref:Serpentine receptor class r-10 n=1 Tax=Caenorhabditis remanei TaxID=31234 RepID=E3NUW1_CAERE|nr:CRE-STR-220 protein [Caenorhabditis remanei]
MNLYDLPQYLHIFNNCASSLAVFFNSVLIYLILTKSPKQLGVYKYLMVFISVFEIFYSILEVSLVPIHYSYRSSVAVLISTSDKLFSRKFLLILNSFYWGFFGSSLAIFGVHFIYRYLVISGNPLLRTFQSWKFILWLLIPVVIGFIWALTGIYLCGPTEEFTEFMRNHVKEVFNNPIEQYEYLGAFMYERSKKDDSLLIYWGPIAGIIIMSITVMVSFIVIIVSGIKCYLRIKRLMRNASTTSSRSQALQAQLFNALVVQTMIPMLLLHTPVSLKFGFAIFDAGLGSYCFIMSMTIALYPAIDPLPNFFIISPYRKAAYGKFRKS